MNFYLSKILWLLINPFNILIFLFLIIILFFYLKKNKFAYFLFIIFLAYLISFGILPTGKLLLHSLEKNYHTNFLFPEKVDGILILSGSTNPFLTNQFNQISLNGSAERLTESIKLIKKYSNAKIIFSGGSGSIKYPELKHAKVANDFFIQMGLSTNNIIFEDRSRNTHENIIFSRKIVNPKINEKWIIVTSAFHMNRSIFIGEKNNWKFIPYAVDFKTMKKFRFVPNLYLLSNINSFQQGSHEWLGLISYYLMNRTDKIF